MLYTASRHGYSEAAAVDLVTRLRFGILVSVSENEPQFSHVPVIRISSMAGWSGFAGHLSRANPHWKALQAAPKATFVFNGANTYISAQWYLPGTPAAPTWGYAVVHVGGAVRLAPDDDATSRIVDDLIRLNEAVLPKQWPLESYSPARRAALLPHIIGFELDVTSFTPKYQIIQAHSDSNKRSAAAGLTSAERMRPARSPN